jgi:hypothetical protein
MARHVWSVLCERVLVDEGTRGVSLIDTAEEIQVHGDLPAERVGVALEMALVSFWVRDESAVTERGETRFSVRAPNGDELDIGAPIDVNLEDDKRVQTVGRIEVMPILGGGRYEYVVQYRGMGQQEWTTCGQVPLDVSVIVPD